MKNIEKIVEGNWDALKGKIRKKWEKLSNNDINEIEGSYKKLENKIKNSYNLTEKEISEQFDSFLEDPDFKEMKNGTESLIDDAKNIKDKLEKIFLSSLENIKTKSVTVEENIVTYVKENPVKSMIFTVLIGVAFSKLYLNKKE